MKVGVDSDLLFYSLICHIIELSDVGVDSDQLVYIISFGG